jgi:glutathione S-transferase
MSKPTLVIANKRHSSWSLRGWLALRPFGVAFEERRVPLETAEFHRVMAELGLNRRVPVLIDGAITVWDSLAICEYANERWLEGKGWPADRAARAMARSVCAEMHAGFSALRNALPMDCKASGAPVPVNEATRLEVARMRELLAGCRTAHGERTVGAEAGPFLFGRWSLADGYFAPIAVRFKGYGVPVEGAVAAWLDALWSHPALVEWIAAARAETEIVPPDILAVP